jgi:Protein of unknown function (DUF1553)/Protein of unknown function (DUF1549)
MHAHWQILIVGIVAGLPISAFAQPVPSEPWSFQKPLRPNPPAVPAAQASRIRNPIDAFVVAKLTERGLRPAPPADKRTLVRRAYYDLLGLPPTPEQVQKFLQDRSPDAYQKLIDELLRSPHYGERWGRHWLDVARYADTGGYETDIYYKNAWRYRDYVIKSFNDDKPYDRFVQEQVAGDELWPDNLDLDGNYVLSSAKRQHLEARIGTGFYALGPQIHESNMDARKLTYERLTDWVDTTGSAFLGVTLGCARCHDHKFDPFSQRDYYGFQAIFAGSKEMEEPVINGMEIADYKQSYPRLIAVDEARKAVKLFEQTLTGRTPTAAEEKKRQELRLALAQAVLALPEKANSEPNDPWVGLMEIPTATVLGHERPELVPAVYLLKRGDLKRPEQRMSPALPDVLARKTGQSGKLSGPFSSRKDLALWLTRPDHPLTPRVMVNRIWQWHFGHGIVDTPSDFGTMGQKPTHPELLDWLATEFVARRWSIKAMHRLIMTSSTYQQSSRYSPMAEQRIDPENRYLWRMERRRLEAEAIWDAVHAVSGTLNLARGGRPIMPPLVAEELTDKAEWVVNADPKEHARRGVYILVRRNFRFPLFEVFDAPVNAFSCPARNVSTVAPQALWLLNNRVTVEQAHQFAARLLREQGSKPDRWIQRAWELALGRPPTTEESAEALRLLGALANHGAGDKLSQKPPKESVAALAKVCLAIFNLNEFTFVD